MSKAVGERTRSRKSLKAKRLNRYQRSLVTTAIVDRLEAAIQVALRQSKLAMMNKRELAGWRRNVRRMLGREDESHLLDWCRYLPRKAAFEKLLAARVAPA